MVQARLRHISLANDEWTYSFAELVLMYSENYSRFGTSTWIKDMAFGRRRFGYRRIHVVLRRNGCRVNHKEARFKSSRLTLWAVVRY